MAGLYLYSLLIYLSTIVVVLSDNPCSSTIRYLPHGFRSVHVYTRDFFSDIIDAVDQLLAAGLAFIIRIE